MATSLPHKPLTESSKAIEAPLHPTLHDDAIYQTSTLNCRSVVIERAIRKRGANGIWSPLVFGTSATTIKCQPFAGMVTKPKK